PIPTTEITVRSAAPSSNQPNNSSLGPSNPTISVSSMKRADNRGSRHRPFSVSPVLLDDTGVCEI
ncbi:hypothetical protein A2U01_0092048, partial [Trifolium medium]|nr:hypothetical protein [Trifolium medium]